MNKLPTSIGIPMGVPTNSSPMSIGIPMGVPINSYPTSINMNGYQTSSTTVTTAKRISKSIYMA